MGFWENQFNSHAHFGKQHNQMPGVASFGNAFGNIKGGFMAGFTGDFSHMSPTKGGFRGTPFNFKKFGDKIDDTLHAGKTAWNPQLSVGGVLTAGYGAVGGALGGAAIGGLGSAVLGAGNPIVAAGVGAGVGAAAAVAAPIVIGGAARLGYEGLAAFPKFAAGVGSGMIKGASKLGKSAIGLASNTNMLLNTGGARMFANPIARHGSAMLNFASKLVKPVADNGTGAIIKGYKFSALGGTLLAAGSLASGAKDAYNYLMNDRMGQRDGRMYSATPTIRLMDDAGASGDLVFALNNNRRG